MKRTLSAFSAGALQHLGLLTALVLLLAAHQFADAHPALTAILVFIFSLPYVVASVVTRRASFLYATMLLGAVSYFLACHALGAPGALLPLLSVPLVIALLVIGHRLRKRLPAEMAAYPTTVFRAMNITVVVFAVWALVQVYGLMGEPGFMRYVAGLTFLGYAGLYLSHCLAGVSAVYTYVFATFLMWGGVLTVGAAAPWNVVWMPAIASAAGVLAVGTRLHGDRKFRWSLHFYLSAAIAIVLSLGLSVLRPSYLVVDLALASLLMWAAYGWLAKVVPDIPRAMLADRVVAKFFFYGSLLVSFLVVPAILIWPASLYVAVAAMICGLTYAGLAWQRRGQLFGARSIYCLGAVLFASAGLLGLGRQLPGWGASVWSIVAALALLIGLGLLRARVDKDKGKVIRLGLAKAAIFPAFLVWFIPLMRGEPIVALIGAAAAAVVVMAEAKRLKETAYAYAAGPALAGVLVAAMSLRPEFGQAAWVVCAAAAAAAGACFLLARARNQSVTWGAAHLAWLILSVATAVFAANANMVQLLYSLTAVGAVSALVAGFGKPEARGSLASLFVMAVAALATIGAVLVGPFSDVSASGLGLCLLILAAVHWLAWGKGRDIWCVRAATGLLSLGALLVIFGQFSTMGPRLAAGAGLVLMLFVLASLVRNRFPKVGSTVVAAGHLTSIVLACAALILCWSLSTWLVPAAAVAFALIYAIMPKLRRDLGFRSGVCLWLSLAVLFALAAHAGTPYWNQLSLVAFLSLIWLAAGHLLGRAKADGWSMPLYVSAAVFAGVCGVISLFMPAAGNSWRVFLVNGIAFACLFLILRQDIFVYLLTLSVSLMAYNWVKGTSSSFTQNILLYLIIGAAVLGAFFSMPYLKRLLTRSGALPMFSIFSWRGNLLLAVPIAGLALAVVMAYTITLTGHPGFCNIACHNMDEYSASWQHSSHKDVACVSCHYDPGAVAVATGKVAGLVQVVQYVSHSYSTNPHALVSNASCMRSKCHAGMDGQKEMLVFQDKVKFRHDKHVDETARGKNLNCVNCHGHTDKDSHINVAQATCVTCHFYDRQDKAVAAGKCDTCHVLPNEPVAFMEQDFDHVKFLKGKTAVQCEHCHSQVTQGGGTVAATRCGSCHVGKSMKVATADPEEFHSVHVSKEHFDCQQCHDEIKHGIRPKPQQRLAAGDCRDCHQGERHSMQEKMYAGTAIPAAEVLPDPMFKARVACNGCHTEDRPTPAGEEPFTRKLASAKQCAGCHGKKRYGQMLADWQEETRERLTELQADLAKLAKACQDAKTDAPAGELAKASAMVKSMQTTLTIIEKDGSFGAHNNPYVSEALDGVEEKRDDCQKITDGWKKVATRSP